MVVAKEACVGGYGSLTRYCVANALLLLPHAVLTRYCVARAGSRSWMMGVQLSNFAQLSLGANDGRSVRDHDPWLVTQAPSSARRCGSAIEGLVVCLR